MGLLALLCGNGYIVGINQIYDVSIDVVNKPFLPVASGADSHAVSAYTQGQLRQHALGTQLFLRAAAAHVVPRLCCSW